jgi:hypothetical protein
MAVSLLVAAEGYSLADVAVDELAPNEVRAVSVELRRGALVGGRLLEHDGATPVPDAQVQLWPVGARARPQHPGWSSTGDEPIAWTTTHADGRFAFGQVADGAYTLHAVANLWLVTTIDELRLDEGEKRGDLQLLLPVSSALELRLVVPEGAELGEGTLTLMPLADFAVERLCEDTWLPLEAVPASDVPTFRARRLPPGRAGLVWRGPQVGLPDGFDGWDNSAPLGAWGVVELAAGRTERVEVDVRVRWPGSLRVQVMRDGAPLADHVVEIAPLDGAAVTGAVSDHDGVALVRHVPPGDWELFVRPVERAWRFRVPERATVLPGIELPVVVAVPLAKGSVRLVDATTGEPLAMRRVWLFEQDDRSTSLTSDAAGRLSLELPPGSYGVQDGSGGKRVGLEWGAAGPLVQEIALETSGD